MKKKLTEFEQVNREARKERIYNFLTWLFLLAFACAAVWGFLCFMAFLLNLVR